jgi:hypothetical protein
MLRLLLLGGLLLGLLLMLLRRDLIVECARGKLGLCDVM